MTDRLSILVVAFAALAAFATPAAAQTAEGDAPGETPPDPFAAPVDDAPADPPAEASEPAEATPAAEPVAEPAPAEPEPVAEPAPHQEPMAPVQQQPMAPVQQEPADDAFLGHMVLGASLFAVGAASLPWWLSRRKVLAETCPCLDQEKISRRRWAALGMTLGGIGLGALFLINGIRLRLRGPADDQGLALEIRGSGLSLSGSF